MILIISDTAGDGHVDPVVDELATRGEECRIFDPATYPGTSVCTLESNGRGARSVLRWDDDALDLSAVKSVWYRRPGDFRLSDRLSSEEAAWLRLECSHLFSAAWDWTDALWVSRPDAIRWASVKLRQLRIARRIGFRVPDFVVTNDPTRAADFIASHPAGVVVKALANPAIARGREAAMLYTHLIRADDLRWLDTVRFGPTFLQAFIEKVVDLRVTVIGDVLFAVAIDSAGRRDTRVDFRRAGTYDLPHEVVALPERLHAACLELVRVLDLRFGAIDIVLAPEGEYYFLEINPNGQWAWLEWVTELPMAKTMCDLLVRGA